uniref:Uncharacterized protein MANES_04G165400 n=1 Tax=Rhizophora mucronata TaxID=61149 RepID=A0A2P2L5S0_RHIMU
MFDWNDEEITNIIWGETGESDDHIVPYPEATEDYCRKEQNEGACNIKSTGQKLSGVKFDIHGRKLEGNPNPVFNDGTSSPGPGMLLWPNLHLSDATKTDHDSLDTSVSNSLIEFTKLDSSRNAEATQPNEESGIFQSPHEAKEQGEFVDYGWANIGSFDDLDRMFSNDDTIFGNVSLANADELWSSTKDVTNSSAKSFPPSVDSPNLGLGSLRDMSESFEIKTDYLQQEDCPFSLGHGKGNDPVCHGLQNADGIPNNVEHFEDESKPLVKEQDDLTILGRNNSENSHFTAENVQLPNELADKLHRQKKLLKSRKKLKENGIYQHLYGDWSSSGTPSSRFKDQYSACIVQSSPSPVLSQQMQIHGPESLQFQQISNPFLAPLPYGGVANSYAPMPMGSHIQYREFKHQPSLSGFEASSNDLNSENRIAESPVKNQTMTPQEKIEKLRRRQQIQAMLAIQKQQRKFVPQVSCSDQSLCEECPQENQIQNVDGASQEVEELTALHSFYPCSRIEQDDSNTVILAASDYSVEDKMLFRLQEIIAKLDVRIRLCIRDSLFRLAQSAKQRQCTANNNGRDGQLSVKDETSLKRKHEMPEVETETNPIDRTVAHLLFHRPLDLSGKHPGTPESPVSAGPLCEQKTTGIPKLSKGCLPETLKCKQNFSRQESKSSCPLADSLSVRHCRSSLCLDISENGSNNGPADEVARDVEASQ